MILITHDLVVIADVAQKIMVMYAAARWSRGRPGGLQRPAPSLRLGAPRVDPRITQKGSRLLAIEGSPPSLINVPPGCPFHPRCPHRFEPCDKERPEFMDRGGEHPEACHLSAEDKRRLWEEREARRLKVAS